MKRRVLLSIVTAVLLIASMATVVAARPLFSQWSAGTASSTIALMNVDPAAQPATYTIDLLGQDGTTDAQISGVPQLAYRGEVRYNIGTYALPLGTGWSGSAIVSSDRQLVAVVNQTYQNPAYSGNDGYNGGAYGSTTPATEIYMPYLTQYDINPSNAGRWCRLTVQNTGSNDAMVYINYYAQDGTPRGQVTRSIGAGRSYTWEPEFLPNPGENRSALITSTNPIVAVFDGFWAMGKTSTANAWSTSYESIPAANAGTRLFYPSVFRVRAGKVETGSWVQWSNLFVQNTDLVATAHVTVTLYRTGQVAPVMQFTDTIPPNAAHEYNTQFGGTGGNPSAAAFRTALGAGYYGSAIIDSDVNIVGVAHSFWSNAGSTYSAMTIDQAATVMYTPMVNRIVSGSTWTAWNKIVVSNVEPSGTATVDVYFIRQDGSVVSFPQVLGIPIAAGASDGFNTRYGTDSGYGTAAQYAAALGNNFQGGVMITSSARLLGINNIIYPNRINTINNFAEP